MTALPLEPHRPTERTSRRMAEVRRRDTAPELALRRTLHRQGLRYFVDRAPLTDQPRRRADLVFPGARLAVFVDGCFWHKCPDHARLPRVNSEWWLSKLQANVARDRDTDARLAAAGWSVLRVWEHEPVGSAALRVCQALGRSPAAPSGSTSREPVG